MSYLRILPLTLAQSLTLPQPLTPYLTLNLSGLEAACALLVHLGAGRDAVDGHVPVSGLGADPLEATFGGLAGGFEGAGATAQAEEKRAGPRLCDRSGRVVLPSPRRPRCQRA